MTRLIEGIKSIENTVGEIDRALEEGNLTPKAIEVLQEMRTDLVQTKADMIDATVPRYP